MVRCRRAARRKISRHSRIFAVPQRRLDAGARLGPAFLFRAARLRHCACGYSRHRRERRHSAGPRILDQEQQDGLEVIDWLSKQPWSNGNVGMMGISWGGFNAIQMARLHPPALKAIIAMCATEDLFHDDIHYIDGLMHARRIRTRHGFATWADARAGFSHGRKISRDAFRRQAVVPALPAASARRRHSGAAPPSRRIITTNTQCPPS